MAAPEDTFELLHYNMINGKPIYSVAVATSYGHHLFTMIIEQHMTHKLGYEIIVSLLDSPLEHDVANFLGYCEAWVLSIEHHHDTEEATVFKLLGEKMNFSIEKEQHKVIHDFLGRLATIIHEAQADHTKFDPKLLKDLMQNAKDTLFTHLDEEVVHFEAERLRDAQITEHELKEIIAAMTEHAKSTGSPFLVVPFMRGHTAPEIRDFWPPMPWVLRKVVVPYVLAMRHPGYWKYAPYGMS